MHKWCIKSVQYLIYCLRGILFPLSALIVPLFLPWARKRRNFEHQNITDQCSRSFRSQGLVADVAFEVSSEGELEQVRPIIDWYLQKKCLVELIYASESVEKKCQLLAEHHPEQLRILRLPILLFSFLNFFGGQSLASWRTARKLILCRYDFYPELMIWGARKDTSFYLVSATLKGKEHKLGSSQFYRWYQRGVYSLFDMLIVASDEDKRRFSSLGIDESRLMPFDFRVLQISSRLQKSNTTLATKPFFKHFSHFVERFSIGKRLLLGSAWPIEIEMFADEQFQEEIKVGNIHVAIAPHKLDSKSVEMLKKDLSGVPVYIIDREMSEVDLKETFEKMSETPGVLINLIPGILCEMYLYYTHVYVGGGHGRSIHSVLEPYLAGARVYCGPKTFRSTEYDLIKSHSPEFIHVVDNLIDFYKLFSRNLEMNETDAFRKDFVAKSQERFLDIVTIFSNGHKQC